MKQQKKHFLQLPQIAGGKKALNEYIEANLVYPQDALQRKIEGFVHVQAEIDDNGNVNDIEILHGLEGGCNEEAVRLIKNIRFGGVKNKGIRVKSKQTFKIKFKLPQENNINYHIIKNASKPSIENNAKSYTYTIQINN